MSNVNSKSMFLFQESLFFCRKLCLIYLVLVHYWVIEITYFWLSYFFNKFIFFEGLRRVWLYFSTLFFIDSNTRIYFSWWKMFFNSSINNTFLWCINSNQFLLLNTSFFLFLRLFDLSSRFLSLLTFWTLNLLATSILFPSFSLFLLDFINAVNSGNHV